MAAAAAGSQPDAVVRPSTSRELARPSTVACFSDTPNLGARARGVSPCRADRVTSRLAAVIDRASAAASSEPRSLGLSNMSALGCIQDQPRRERRVVMSRIGGL
ncbi:hypothetical protein E2562_037754 [Oryza meyeriana var. granulata]|uniref:Uncharacterized protein n=1 Tax=Oryza meyeriana var. granulata TaxID=110450 RepID=A0A6G1FGK1_9ORYZ|nr:hypothetical protein E2562_037754 [Oryza meyeriana var. granulata]